jgi:hypothetical protein
MKRTTGYKPSPPEVTMFTPTQQRMMNVLSDGLPHSLKELVACLDYELASPRGVAVHITFLRRKLRPIGQDVSCERLNHISYYRLVRLMHSANDGYR